MSEKPRKARRAVSIEQYSGQWIAWDRKETRILAHGRDVAEVREAAIKAGEPKPLLQKVPEEGVVFMGGV